MANLIICCDGTWNTADERSNGVPCPTNVSKIFDAVADVDAENVKQLKYYHPGVGTEGGKLNKLIDGAIGEGLDKNIKSAYKWIADHYAVDDRIYLFGFSRGAYTARYVAGMICGLGLVNFVGQSEERKWSAVDEIYAAVKLASQKKGGKPVAPKGLNFFGAKPGESGAGKTQVHFVGVWDTVGALGIPDDLAILNLLDNPANHRFPDEALSEFVTFGRHAVAMDERRQNFTPTLWSNADAHGGVKQIWFPGVHSDVGGGYVETGLSDGSCLWMAREAQGCGLGLREDALAQLSPSALGVLHDSATGVFAHMKTLPRAVPEVCDPCAALFHESVLARHRNPPIGQGTYWPTQALGDKPESRPIYAREHWNRTGLYLEAGVEYAFDATGEWMDGSIRCGPEGDRQAPAGVGKFVHSALSALGELEVAYRAATGDKHADFWGTKRIEKFDWFALVGAVANGAGADADGNPIPHEYFKIGAGTKFKPKKSGYLYCFANDAWLAYGNNAGSVTLKVSRTGRSDPAS